MGYMPDTKNTFIQIAVAYTVPVWVVVSVLCRPTLLPRCPDRGICLQNKLNR